MNSVRPVEIESKDFDGWNNEASVMGHRNLNAVRIGMLTMVRMRRKWQQETLRSILNASLDQCAGCLANH